jgi:hypothetical protein
VTNSLSLEVVKNNNPKTLILLDSSLIANTPENYLVEILSPTATKWKTLKVNPNFSLVLNATALGLCSVSKSSQLPDLQDGVYEIKQSEKPNYETAQHFYHLRVSSLQKKYDETLCCLYSKQYSLSRQEFEMKRTKLLSILMDMKAAVSKVEVCHDRKQGIELYKKAENELKEFNNGCRCS